MAPSRTDMAMRSFGEITVSIVRCKKELYLILSRAVLYISAAESI